VFELRRLRLLHEFALRGTIAEGTYHSTYDNATWFKKFVDPDFKFSVLASKTTALAAFAVAADRLNARMKTMANAW